MSLVLEDNDKRYPFICSADGRHLGPDNDVTSIEDVAASLGKQCRFAGHSRVFYSVLLHSLVVCDLLPPLFKLYGLLHDAAESVITDIPSPFKYDRMKAVEKRIFSQMLKSYGIPEPNEETRLAVKQADTMAFHGEAWTVGPLGLRKLYPERCSDAERLVEHNIKIFPPHSSINENGAAVLDFLSRYRAYRRLVVG